MPDSSAHRPFDTALAEAQAMMNQLAAVREPLENIAETCARAMQDGHRVFFCGNGGSAAESQHLATEFVVRLSAMRERRALPAIALTTDTSLLTACSNDYGFDYVFARQVEAHLQPGDVLILLSTSGKSANLLRAAAAARARSGITISFLGPDRSPLDELCDLALHVPSPSSQRVQEAHLFCGHLLVEMVEDRLMQGELLS